MSQILFHGFKVEGQTYLYILILKAFVSDWDMTENHRISSPSILLALTRVDDNMISTLD